MKYNTEDAGLVDQLYLYILREPDKEDRIFSTSKACAIAGGFTPGTVIKIIRFIPFIMKEEGMWYAGEIDPLKDMK